MSKRPLSITLVGWLFVATGCIGLGAGLWRLRDSAAASAGAPDAHELMDFAFVAFSAALAVVGGACTLRGLGLGRWLLGIWMVGHIVLGLWHPPVELLMHLALFAPLSFLLLRRPASDFFRGVGTGAS